MSYALYGGPLDILCILKLPAGTFHAAFFEEYPLPGPLMPAASLVRLKSKMHHTAGASTLEGAQEHLDDLKQKISVPAGNVLRDAAIEVDDPVNVWLVPNWSAGTIDSSLRQAGLL